MTMIELGIAVPMPPRRQSNDHDTVLIQTGFYEIALS